VDTGRADLIKSLRVSVVVPCYNEELVLNEFLDRMAAACEAAVGQDYEIIVVNDGSYDRTWALISENAAKRSHIVGVDLSRNHGHQLAVTAGLSLARGERVMIIDADLQDRPELLPDMMAAMNAGADVVYGQRRQRDGETRFKLLTARIFYRLLRSMAHVEIPLDTGDFRLINRRTLERLNSMPEQYRFLRGMVAWLGGKQVALLYDRDPRFAGETKYTLRKMVRFALDAITGFSATPLRMSMVMGIFSGGLSMLLLLYSLIAYLYFEPVPGWTSTVVVVLFFSMVQLVSLGIIGEYIGRMYIESKRRPLFLIQEIATSANTPNTAATSRNAASDQRG
jgi:polyisoprenyl-phosphate glycosyltransferase